MDWRYKYGPGIGTAAGYQHVFKGKWSLGAEMCVITMKNINEHSLRSNHNEVWFFGLLNVKAGFRF